MTATPPDLPGFLLARYREREATLRTLLDSKITDELPETARGLVFFIEAHDDGLLGQPTAVRELFVDLAAKRAIVALYRRTVAEQVLGEPQTVLTLGVVLMHLAAEFADHPSYRPEWTPPA